MAFADAGADGEENDNARADAACFLPATAASPLRPAARHAATADAFALIYGGSRSSARRRSTCGPARRSSSPLQQQQQAAPSSQRKSPEPSPPALRETMDFTVYSLPPRAPTTLMKGKGALYRLTAATLQFVASQNSNTSADDPYWITTWLHKTEEARTAGCLDRAETEMAAGPLPAVPETVARRETCV